MPPTADIADPFNGKSVTASQLNTLGHIDVRFNDRSGTGIKESSILDAAAEFEVLVNGTAAGLTFLTPTRVSGNTFRYAFTGTLPTTATGIVTVRFLPNSFSDNTSGSGTQNAGETEQFYLVTLNTSTQQPNPPAPIAVLASPTNGESLTVQALNARRYIDVTFQSLDGTPINKQSITDAAAEFTITGAGVADLAVDATNHPLIVGEPSLVAGTSATATSVTYRYFLKDKNTQNAIDLFQPGQITIAFGTTSFCSGSGSCTVNNGNGAGMTQSFTLSAAAPGAAAATGAVNLGPLRLQGPSVGLADFGFKDGMLLLTVAIGLDRATLALGNAAQAQQSGVTVDLTGILGTFDLSVDALGLLSGNFRVNVPGKFSLRVAGLEVKVPDVVQVNAEGILIQYDPAGPASQELVRVNSATVLFPKLGVRGIIKPFDPSAGHNVTDPGNAPGIIPGLVVRGNGFSLGVAELRIGGVPAPNSTAATPTAGDGKIRLGSILEFDDIRIGVQNFSVTFGAAIDFNGSIYVASGGAKLFPGGAFSVTISDRKTADDRNADGSDNDEAIRLQLSFAHGHVDSFQFQVDTLEVKLSTFVTLKATGFSLNTGAAAGEELVSFVSVGAKVKIGPVEVTGDARNFAFLGDGTFKTKNGFGVFLSVGSATGSAFGIPPILGVRIDEIGVQWVDVEHHPEDFTLIVSASVTDVKVVPGLVVSGAIKGMKIQPSLLAEGKFPIISIDSFGVSVKGEMFGGELDAQLVGGVLRLDSNYNIIGTFDSTTPVAQRVFYLGIEGGFSMAGMGGFTIRLGLSELGPLQVLINVEVPGGLLLEPITGLSMNDFVAGVEFFKTLPSIDDPFALRNPDFQLPTQISVADWLTSLQGQVARQAKTLHDTPGQSGFAAAFTSPMLITGSAKIFTIYTSKEIFNGQVTVKISTDGKILIIGTLNFAHDLISISGRLYADLSKISSGNATVLFLADIPDQVRLLTIYGKLKMGFTNASGQEVTFDVVDAPTSTPAGTSTPTAQLVSPAPGAGSVDISVVKGTATNPSGAAQNYLDVVYRAPSGASLDYSSIINATTTHFTVSGAGFSTPVAV